MKWGQLLAIVTGTIALANVTAAPGKYSEVASMLNQLEDASSKNLVLKENEDLDAEDNDEADDRAMIQEVNALLERITGENALLAAMMAEDEEAAVAWFRRYRSRSRRPARFWYRGYGK